MVKKKSSESPQADEHAAAAAAAAAAADAETAAAPAAASGAGTPEGDAPDAELLQLRERLLRLQADFDNYRKRVVRDESARMRRATENLVAELLPVVDHFEMGLKSAAEHGASPALIEGFELVKTQLCDVLAKEGVKPVVTAGAVFDPQCHECVAHLPSEDHPEGMIMGETRRGYWLGDYLLRPAQVLVSSGPPAAAAEQADAADPGSEAS